MTTEQMIEKLDRFQGLVDKMENLTGIVKKESFDELGAPFEVWQAFMAFSQGFWNKAGMGITMELLTSQMSPQMLFMSTILTGFRLGWMLRGEVQGVEELNKMMGVNDAE